MAHPAVLFLLDWQPTSWSTREEFFLQLSERLFHQGVIPLLTFSGDVPSETRSRLEESGGQVTVVSYHQPLRYWTYIRKRRQEHELLLFQIRFFDYFTLLLWMCRLSGAAPIIFTEANSGEWSDRGDWRARLIQWRAAVACRPVTRFIAISEFIKRRLVALGIRGDRISVVYNGVDTRRYLPDPQKRQILEDEFSGDAKTLFVLFASALLEWKRPEIALRICAELVQRGVAVRMLMAGSGPLRASLEATSRELRIQDQVCWLGQREELQELFQGVDLFLHTSTGEAFGNVLVEAMACGVPIVATRSGAAQEIIEEGVTGLLVESGIDEAERAADAIQTLWEDPARRSVMGQASIRQAARFTVEACVEKTLAVYSEVTGGRIQSN